MNVKYLSEYGGRCSYCKNVNISYLYSVGKAGSNNHLLEVLKQIVDVKCCISHQCRVCYKNLNVIELENMVKDNPACLPELNECKKHWCCEHSFAKIEIDGNYHCPIEICKFYKLDHCGIQISSGRTCRNVCSICFSRHKIPNKAYCEDCTCCVDRCNGRNLKPVALYCMAHHLELMNNYNKMCLICGNTNIHELKDYGCSRCICNTNNYNLTCHMRLPMTNSIPFCEKHRCDCLIDKEIDSRKRLHVDGHGIAHYIPDFLLDKDLTKIRVECLINYREENLVVCQIQDKDRCEKIALVKNRDKRMFDFFGGFDGARAYARKAYPHIDFDSFSKIDTCDKCKLPKCSASDCRFYSWDLVSLSPLCVFHLETPNLCINPSCSNLLEKWPIDTSFLNFDALLRFCGNCQSERRQLVVSISSPGFDEDRIIIYPWSCEPLIRKKTIQYKHWVFTKCILMGNRKPSVAMEFSPEMKILFYKNLLMFGNHEAAYNTTKCQEMALIDNPNLVFHTNNIKDWQLALFLLDDLPINIAVYIISMI